MPGDEVPSPKQHGKTVEENQCSPRLTPKTIFFLTGQARSGGWSIRRARSTALTHLGKSLLPRAAGQGFCCLTASSSHCSRPA